MEELQPLVEAFQVKLPSARMMFWHFLSLQRVGSKKDSVVSIPGDQSTANSNSHRTIYSFISSCKLESVHDKLEPESQIAILPCG